MSSNHKAQITLQNLTIQAKHAEIFPSLHSSLISIKKFFDDECIINFDKHRVVVGKYNPKIIEGYQDPINGL